MQFQQLAYFVAVADHRHFTRAADQARVAQPSLSQQIRALEHDLGAPLFHRIRGNVSLTEAGETLLPIARRILADTEAARRAIRELAELDRGRVRLGAPPSLCTGLLPAMLAAFRRRYPGIQLELHESGSGDLRQRLAEGALDLALLAGTRTAAGPGLTATPLLLEELVVISPAPLAGDRLGIEQLADVPLVMFRRGYDVREATVNACRAAGFEPSFAIEGGEMDAVLELVRAGVGAAVVPRTVAGDRFPVTRFAPGAGMTRVVQLAHREDVEPTRAVRALHTAIVGFVADPARRASLPPGIESLVPRPVVSEKQG
ncbi:LysR family transcriptional regulator [Amycolatopsis vancoresmycina]|uniref:LysR family transcriptional regulator n=1 Tax=Amycolatopsis vancoresmycina DSM 44592 TaxID=1292037 RepID=R1G213_9PSEU|nr:LysR substrate-binding domain-containing protein [Amycolatopsis vancoresmycina]EOD65497.1 LysR family transcriptional regulator [Amycolatopsis vancoresmycina DSM 44592]